MSLLLGACGGPDATDAAPDGELPAICADAPTVTWESFGAGFVKESCQPCHATTAPDRHDAPEVVAFDAEEDVWRWAPQVLHAVAGEPPTMPPQGGVSDDDRYLLEVWLTCGS
jgi:uncharacterized membrane protein